MAKSGHRLAHLLRKLAPVMSTSTGRRLPTAAVISGSASKPLRGLLRIVWRPARRPLLHDRHLSSSGSL